MKWKNTRTVRKKVSAKYEPQDRYELKVCMQSRLWRLNNLYTIKNKEAEIVRFRMNWAQKILFGQMHTRNVILKVRQLGCSTFWLLYMLDSVIFHPGVETGCIAHNREDAQELFENKIKLAYDHLPKEIKESLTQTSDSSRKLAFSNGSSIRVGTSFRSGTPVIVLVSEYGKIASAFPRKAREIQTGTFNAVPSNGILVVESTAEGNEGYFYQMVEEADKKAKNPFKKSLTPYDFKLFFFDWMRHPEYRINPDDVDIPDHLHKYFDRIEQEVGITIEMPSRAWYTAKSGGEVTDDMKREYPSTKDEAFEISIEGAYFSQQMSNLRKKERILQDLDPHPSYLVDTAWDIGYDDAMTIIFFQVVPPNIYIIDYYENNHEGLSHYARILDEKRRQHDIIYGKHFGPHDVQQHSPQTGKSFMEYARTFGIVFTPLPKPGLKRNSIEAARRVLPTCFICKRRCYYLIKCLDNYRKEYDEKLGTYKDNPRHDWASHGADAMQGLAVGVETHGGSVNSMTSERANQLLETYGPPI